MRKMGREAGVLEDAGCPQDSRHLRGGGGDEEDDDGGGGQLS